MMATTQIDPRDFDIGVTDAFAHESDGIVGNKWEINRWTKHGHDRLYFQDADGYVDVETGEVHGDAPVVNVEVEKKYGETWVLYYVEKADIDHSSEKLAAAVRR